MDSSSRFSSRLLILQMSLLLGGQTVRDPSLPCTLNKTVGGSVQLQLSSSLGLNIREIEWKWDSEDETQQLLVTWKPDTAHPAWYDFEDKYKHRFSLTEMAFLNIRNLTIEMRGLYAARIKFHSGKSQEESFRLCVYEPAPRPQILIHSSSKASGWCHVTLECATPGAAENLTTVSWLSKGLPRELERRGTLGPAASSRNLSLSLPLRRASIHLTCVASNPADQKNATFYLGSSCPWTGSHWSKWLWRGILVTVLILILGVGVWIWKRRKMETKRGGPTPLPAAQGSAAAARAFPAEDNADLQTAGIDCHSPVYAEISFLRHPKSNTEKGSSHVYRALSTVYKKKIRTSPESKGTPGP